MTSYKIRKRPERECRAQPAWRRIRLHLPHSTVSQLLNSLAYTPANTVFSSPILIAPNKHRLIRHSRKPRAIVLPSVWLDLVHRPVFRLEGFRVNVSACQRKSQLAYWIDRMLLFHRLTTVHQPAPWSIAYLVILLNLRAVHHHDIAMAEVHVQHILRVALRLQPQLAWQRLQARPVSFIIL